MFRYYESKSITQKYKYRPHYPVKIAEDALGNLKEKKLDFLLDVGCGGGQAVKIFAPYFDKVLAIDPSENQLEEARSQNKFAHVTYEVGLAEKLPCNDVSVDVITVASALHWLDRQKFYEEVDRVLKPGGRLIVFAYWTPILVPIGLTGDVTKLSEIASELIQDVYLLGTKGNPDYREIYLQVCNKYAQIYNEIKYAKKLRYDHFTEQVWSITELKGYIQSIDSYETYMKDIEMQLEEFSEKERKAKLLELDSSEQFIRSIKETVTRTDTEVMPKLY
uniref:putative methyltransferase DDB_G0268948 n=1 Tax=Ciona intestinalis TaxID=7719 RepID=UPI0005213CEA|nr:putative methyltransferase DDB_G0268948 [Ciona intestinalis]|eukprot:XP_009860793.1 putative methyltransferase DDB_G0268948 [Ciona intestinalis]